MTIGLRTLRRFRNRLNPDQDIWMFNLRAGLDFCAEPVTAAAQSQSMRAGLNACRTGSIRDSYTDISPRSHRF